MKHFCNRKKSCSFLEEWDEEVFFNFGRSGYSTQMGQESRENPIWPYMGDRWFIDCSRNGTNLDSEEKSNRVSTKSRNKSRIESVTSRLKHKK